MRATRKQGLETVLNPLYSICITENGLELSFTIYDLVVQKSLVKSVLEKSLSLADGEGQQRIFLQEARTLFGLFLPL